jgi:pimeloyl-ACP methyl ester carboxylesterase
MLDAVVETAPNGKHVRVARLGSGPPVLLLHGYPENLHIWTALAPRLARFATIALDWPGMGDSEAWDGGATPFHMADRLVALVDSWGLRRVAVVGTDMGGQPALAFAARYPDRVDRLVVMNSLVLWHEATSWEIRALRRYGWNRWLLRRLPRLVFERAIRTALSRPGRLPAELRADFWRCWRRPEVRAFVVKMCAGYQATLRGLAEVFPTISCPTLVLWAERDRHFPPAHARRLHAAVPGSTLRILEGAEHWMALERADEVALEIARFLSAGPYQ